MRHRRIVHLDVRAVGFDEGTGPDDPNVLELGGFRTTHLALSDPSGAGIRWTGDLAGGALREEPILRGGPVTMVRARSAVRADDVWASLVLAEVVHDQGTTPVVTRVSDLAATVAVWQPDRPVATWLSLWPRQLWLLDDDDEDEDEGDGADDAGAAAALRPGAWIAPDPYAAGNGELVTRLAGRVGSLAVHVNACTGALFGVAVVDGGPGRPSVLVPLSGDDLAGSGLEVGNVVAVEGVLRAAYAGPPFATILQPMTLHWLASQLDLGRVGPQAQGVRAVPPGHTWTTAPAPGALVLSGAVAAAGAGPGLGTCVVHEEDDEVTLAGVGLADDEETWLCDLELPGTAFATGGPAVLVTTAERVCVVDGTSGEFLLWATDPPPGVVRWVVSPVALWGLVGTDAADAGPWTLLRLPRSRWSTDRPSFAALADRWDLPAATGRGDGYQRPSLRPGDTTWSSAVAVVPDGAGPGTVVRVGAEGEPEVSRPSADRLPLGALATPAGELVTTRQGASCGSLPLEQLSFPLDRRTSWVPVTPAVVGGEIVPAYEHADERGPTRLGVLVLGPDGPRWHEVERTHDLNDVRWVRDAQDEHLVWWSSCSPTGTRVGRVDVRTGRVSSRDLDGVVADLLCAGSAVRRCVLRVHPPTDRVPDPDAKRPAPTSTVRYLEMDLR